MIEDERDAQARQAGCGRAEMAGVGEDLDMPAEFPADRFGAVEDVEADAAAEHAIEFALGWPYSRHPLAAAAALATHSGAWALGAAETWVVCHLMGLAVSPAQALILDSLFCGLRTFGFAVPAALGVQEAGYVLACALIGVPAAPAVALSLLRRVRELLVGAPALGVWQAVEGGRALAGLSDK